MQTVWKYQLQIKDRQTISIPEDHRILCVQTQRDIPCIWALVEDTVPKKELDVIMHGTGHNANDIQDWMQYIGTFQIDNGSLIFHVWVD